MTHKSFKTLGRMDHRVRLFVLVRARSLDVDSYILRIELDFWFLPISCCFQSSCLWDGRTRRSVSPGRGLPFGRGPRSGSDSSESGRPESSISVVSVPFDDGAIGDGSRLSLGLEVNGDDWGGNSSPECSDGLQRPLALLGTVLRGLRRETDIDEMIGDRNGLGEDGESVYGEKADIKLLFGDGINGDFNAIIMMLSPRG